MDLGSARGVPDESPAQVSSVSEVGPPPPPEKKKRFFRFALGTTSKKGRGTREHPQKGRFHVGPWSCLRGSSNPLALPYVSFTLVAMPPSGLDRVLDELQQMQDTMLCVLLACLVRFLFAGRQRPKKSKSTIMLTQD